MWIHVLTLQQRLGLLQFLRELKSLVDWQLGEGVQLMLKIPLGFLYQDLSSYLL